MIETRRVFIDTNVLIYARTNSDIYKRQISQAWLDRLTHMDRLTLSLQVLNELTRWVLRNERVPLPVARQRIDMLREFGESPLQPWDTELAWDVRAKLGYQWFDCLLLASAVSAGCVYFLSEDMGHETRYRTLTIINPFRVDPDAFLRAN
jgi:predicted nucleic acid-binding protein